MFCIEKMNRNCFIKKGIVFCSRIIYCSIGHFFYANFLKLWGKFWSFFPILMFHYKDNNNNFYWLSIIFFSEFLLHAFFFFPFLYFIPEIRESIEMLSLLCNLFGLSSCFNFFFQIISLHIVDHSIFLLYIYNWFLFSIDTFNDDFSKRIIHYNLSLNFPITYTKNYFCIFSFFWENYAVFFVHFTINNCFVINIT